MSLLDLISDASKKPTYTSKHYEPMVRKYDITGKKYGKLTVIKGEYAYQSDVVVCQCECGEISKREVSSLFRGTVGCTAKTHLFGTSKQRSETATQKNQKLGDRVKPKLASGLELSKMYIKLGISKSR